MFIWVRFIVTYLERLVFYQRGVGIIKTTWIRLLSRKTFKAIKMKSGKSRKLI